ncbi:MAG: hypothetical protein LAT58_01650 [Opitutales bacterium]|nr:hypothetical protein [Opitutales bacterium]
MSELPDLFEFDSIEGNEFQERWDKYIEAVYKRFLKGVPSGKLSFRGQKISCQYRPETHGKHFAFWHMMQESYLGKSEDDRTPDFERCKRVDWISWGIQNVDNAEEVRVFRQRPRGREKPWAIWLYKRDYVIILWERNGYYLLKTAFPVRSGKRRELVRDWNNFKTING